MDNDGALLEVLRNTYKGLRFRWKYRGLIILPAEQGNARRAAISVRPLRCNRDAHRGRIFDREIYRENQG